MKVYVASSWRNPYQQRVVQDLRAEGHEVYDFRHPIEGEDEFHWSEIDPKWELWSYSQFIGALDHPLAERVYRNDMYALASADAVVLVMPSGRSAHLELGYAIGAGKRTAILLDGGEPELMYKMASYLTGDIGHIISWLAQLGDT